MSKNKKENIFEILDGIMFQLSKTKKMFLIMILTVLIIPPISLLVMTSVADPPFQEQFEQRLQEGLDSGGITLEEYENIKNKLGHDKPPNLLYPPHLIITVMSLVWLGIGIKQWTVLSKWDRKYQSWNSARKEMDKELKDESDEE